MTTTRALRRGAVGLLAVPLATMTLAACGEAEAGAGEEWREPQDYAYTLVSECGERALMGTFRVTVADGRVVESEPIGENHTPESVRIPSIGELLAEAGAAGEDGADMVDIARAEDGRPTAIEIDYDASAIDDEACYEINDYEPV